MTTLNDFKERKRTSNQLRHLIRLLKLMNLQQNQQCQLPNTVCVIRWPL